MKLTTGKHAPAITNAVCDAWDEIISSVAAALAQGAAPESLSIGLFDRGMVDAYDLGEVTFGPSGFAVLVGPLESLAAFIDMFARVHGRTSARAALAPNKPGHLRTCAVVGDELAVFDLPIHGMRESVEASRARMDAMFQPDPADPGGYLVNTRGLLLTLYYTEPGDLLPDHAMRPRILRWQERARAAVEADGLMRPAPRRVDAVLADTFDLPKLEQLARSRGFEAVIERLLTDVPAS